MAPAKSPCVLLDRDGVINRRIPGGYVTSWEKFEFLPRSLDALRLLSENGYTTIVISNQACVGKGLLSVDELDAITSRFLLEAAQVGATIARVYYCHHRPDDRCGCRKPQPGLILRARLEFSFDPSQTFLVGDLPSDLQAAEAAGCPAILIHRDVICKTGNPSVQPTDVAIDLYEAVELILRARRSCRNKNALVRR